MIDIDGAGPARGAVTKLRGAFKVQFLCAQRGAGVLLNIRGRPAEWLVTAQVVVQWFAERVDLIVLLFDPFKLDISDELTGVIRRFRGHEDKVRVVLNKSADSASV